MHTSWGSSPILFGTLSYDFIITSFDPYQVCVVGRQIFFFLVLCAIMKSVEGLVYLLEPCSLVGSLLSHLLIFVFPSWWDKSLSMLVLFILYAHWLLFCSLVELWNQSCVNLILWYNLDNYLSCTLLCVLLVYLVFCQNCIFFWLLKVLCMHIYYMYILWHACFRWSIL